MVPWRTNIETATSAPTMSSSLITRMEVAATGILVPLMDPSHRPV